MLNLKSTFFIIGILSSIAAFSQSGTNPEALSGSGKIWVVLAVVLTILAGLIFYMVRLDKKISNLEKDTRS